MIRKKRQKEKETPYVDEEKLSDEIVAQTMKEIFDSLAEEEKENQETEGTSEEEHHETEEIPENQEVKESGNTVKEKKYVSEEEGPEILDLNVSEDEKENTMPKKTKMIILGVIGAIIAVYLGISLFFINHYYFGTTINGVSFSAQKVDDVEKYMKKRVDDYVFTLQERDGKTEQIKGVDVDLQYKVGNELHKALKDQNPLLWITSVFGKKDAEVVVEVDYNKEKLDQLVAALEVMKPENQIAPVSAQPVYDGAEFVIQEETYGAQIHSEQFLSKVHEYVGQFRSELDLEKEECYVLPRFTKDSEEVVAARDTMNTYLSASVTYSIEPAAAVDSSLISQWLSVDADMNVVISSDSVEAYVTELCKKYNTAGKVRTIKTPTGKVAQVSGGGYGWKINYDAEYAQLLEDIKSGQAVTREPVYAQKAAAHGAADWGNTYLEVDLSTQHMWYIVNGAVAFESDIVTGLPTPERETPQGVYTILEKMRNKTLVGEIQPDGKPEYETPVEYWLRVTWSGIGFHDATWQPVFGGDRYKIKGSHGCINMPLGAVGQLYGMVEKGCPVVMHY